jgi:hypothetical protein
MLSEMTWINAGQLEDWPRLFSLMAREAEDEEEPEQGELVHDLGLVRVAIFLRQRLSIVNCKIV